MSIAFRSIDVSASPVRNHADAIVATDGELLMRFVRQRDHAAFAQIVERHGRLVWMICRQVLRHHQDVEDAFQATFLILADRAQSIRASDSAAAWLFGVAQRTALSARRKRSRRREEALVDELSAVEESVRAIDNREMLYVLIQEIQSLPDRYQAPLVMRYLEGQSRRAIAEQTDSTVGQIQGRLVRGRRMLRSRFLRRGASLSLAAGAAASDAVTAEAAITRLLVDSTAEACLANRTTGSVSGLSPATLALASEGIKTMWYAFVAKCAAAVAAVVLAGGIAWSAQQGGQPVDAAGNGEVAPKIALQVAAEKSSKVGSGQNGATEAAIHEPAARGATPTASTSLKKRIESAWQALAEEMENKVRETITAELSQLEKAALQKKREHLENWLSEFDAPAQTSSGEELTKEAKVKRNMLRDTVSDQLNGVKAELTKAVVSAAKSSVALDRAQMLVTQRQREIDELKRLQMQTELAEEMAASQQKTVSKPSAPGGKLGPGDAVCIRVVNAFNDQPINDTYHVESMGTVALGPRYGRVKVAGLTIFEAEEAVKKHLAEIIENPELQISEPPGPNANLLRPESSLQYAGGFSSLRGVDFPGASPTTPSLSPTPANQTPHEIRYVPMDVENQQVRIIKTLQQEQESLRKENAELKKQMEQRTQPPAAPRGADSKKSGEFLRPGDLVGIRIITNRGGGKEEERTYVANVDSNGQLIIQNDSSLPKIHVDGLDEAEATKAIRILLGTSSGQEVHVEWSHSGQDSSAHKR